MATLSTISPQSAFQWAKKHPFPACLALGSLSALSIYLLSNLIKAPCRKRNKVHSSINQSNEKQETEVRKQLQRLKISREKLHAATKDFKLQFEEEQILTKILTEDCVLAIFDQCIDLVDQVELNRIYQNSRTARRTVFKQILINAEIKSSPHKQSHEEQFPSHNSELLNESFPAASQITTPKNMSSLKSKLAHATPITYPEAMSFSQVYYRFVCTFEEEFKYLIEKTQKDFAIFLNIDFSLITESIDFHISKQNNEYFKQKIEEWTSGIRQTLKNKLTKYNQPIDPVQIRQILKHQVTFLTQKRHKLRETINRLGISNEQELDALPTLLATILEDQVFFKYQIQQEQMTVDMMHLSKNKELEDLVEQFQILTEEIVEEMYQQVNKDAIQVDDDQEV